MTEPVSKADELPVAQKLAQHPRWEWRAGMRARHGGVDYRIAAGISKGRFRVARLGRCGYDERFVIRTSAEMVVMGLAPDLADDATAGVVLGMVRAWAGETDGGDLMAEWSQNDDDWRVDARRFDPDYIQHAGFGPTLGDAAGACLLACWALDDAQSTETTGAPND